MEAQATDVSVSRSGALELEPITFVCWRWQPTPNYRSKFPPETISTLKSMLGRHYHGPHELICITDRPAEVPQGIRAIQLWDDFKNVPSPHGRGYPSCYKRLKLFSKLGAELIRTPRFCSIDLDVVVISDITSLFTHTLDFKMYGDTARGTPYNGSLIYSRVGAHPELWSEFDPLVAPRLSLAKRYIGSDQGWIAVCLGPDKPKFTKKEGVYSFRNEVLPRGGALPPDARLVVFHGQPDPWEKHTQVRYPWVAKHYR